MQCLCLLCPLLPSPVEDRSRHSALDFLAFWQHWVLEPVFPQFIKISPTSGKSRSANRFNTSGANSATTGRAEGVIRCPPLGKDKIWESVSFRDFLGMAQRGTKSFARDMQCKLQSSIQCTCVLVQRQLTPEDVQVVDFQSQARVLFLSRASLWGTVWWWTLWSIWLWQWPCNVVSVCEGASVVLFVQTCSQRSRKIDKQTCKNLTGLRNTQHPDLSTQQINK